MSDIVEACRNTQAMIDITKPRLDGLRTQCFTSKQITQKEIQDTEAKLVKLMGKILILKQNSGSDSEISEAIKDFPDTARWLQIVDLSETVIEGLSGRDLSVEGLLEMNDKELFHLVKRYSSVAEEDAKKLSRALQCLRTWTEHQLKPENGECDVMELHWSSYSSSASSPYGNSSHNNRPSTSSLPADVSPSPVEENRNGDHSNHGSVPSLQSTSRSNNPPSKLSNSIGQLTHSPDYLGNGVGGASSSTPPASVQPQGHGNSPLPTPTSPVYHTHSCAVGQGSPAGSRRRNTPPPTPPMSKGGGGGGAGGSTATGTKDRQGKFPTTPPPHKRNKLYPSDGFPLTKSKSHESQLSTRVNAPVDSDQLHKYIQKKPMNLTLRGSYEAICRRRKSAGESSDGSRAPSGQSSPLVSSPKRSPPYKHSNASQMHSNATQNHHGHHLVATETQALTDDNPRKHQLTVPMSPNANPWVGMQHSINHRFTNTFRITTCDYCQKQMFLGYKCKECKFQTRIIVGACDYCKKHVILGRVCRDCKLRFHKDCAAKAAPSCGLPDQFVDLFIHTIRSGSPASGRRSAGHSGSLPTHYVENGQLRSAVSVPAFQQPGSSSTSSCNSSTPSSPAPFLHANMKPASPAPMPSPTVIVTDTQQRFCFPPDVTISTDSGLQDSIGTESCSTLMESGHSLLDHSDVVSTSMSNDSDKSDKTLIDTGSSQGDRGLLMDRVDSADSAEDGGQNWQRVNSISITLKEWDIPYGEVHVGPLIGVGRFGTVYRGNWHGDVAVKKLKLDPERDNQVQLKAFKLEVAMLRKTRHDNLVLFMGACMQPPDLAIITRLCKGQSLHESVHLRKEKFQLNKCVIIGTQIAQGMGYLHHKGIFHKDLKSKNVFVENGKVIITDFGLFSITKLCHGAKLTSGLYTPPGWLCYLAPEIVRELNATNQYDTDLPFSCSSDVYAFGTVWYEMLCGEFPFKNQPPESIIWQVGRGIKQSLGHVQASKDVKAGLLSLVEDSGKVAEEKIGKVTFTPDTPFT